MSSIQQVWPIPLIKDNEQFCLPLIVQKNNMAVYAHALLSGDSVEGD